MEEKIKSENDKKKEYLGKYLGHVRKINRIELELKEVRTMSASISVNNDGMPHSSGQSDLSGYAAELDRLERDLMEERTERIIAYKDIAKRIKKIKIENEMDVLFYRYIAGLDWWEIAEKIGYSERQVHRYHGKALAHFEIPKDVIECQ